LTTKTKAAQLRELHRQGFARARRDRLGRVILERAHYDAVAAQRTVAPAAPQLRIPRLHIAA
jgi:hypothetical protein